MKIVKDYKPLNSLKETTTRKN